MPANHSIWRSTVPDHGQPEARVRPMIKLTSQPVWLFDVDGVINAPRPRWSEAPHRADIWAKGAYWRMRWSPSMLHELRSIERSGTVQLVYPVIAACARPTRTARGPVRRHDWAPPQSA